MSKVCAICGKKPAFGNHRSHSMVATKRRFDPNLQRVRMLAEGLAEARVRLHPLPQGRQGAEGRLAPTAAQRLPSARASAPPVAHRSDAPARRARTEDVPPTHVPRHAGASGALDDVAASARSRSRATSSPRSSPRRARCYGVVGLSAGSRVGRILRRDGISVGGDAKALRIELHVVVEHGLNLAEVAATVRSQVAYEVERLTGLRVAAVEVVIQRRAGRRA